MTPTDKAVELIQDIIDTHIRQTGQHATAGEAATVIAEQLAIIPRTDIPAVDYDETEHSYRHMMGACHESFGSATALAIAAEWIAIAEDMQRREDAAEQERQIAELRAALTEDDTTGILPLAELPAAYWPDTVPSFLTDPVESFAEFTGGYDDDVDILALADNWEEHDDVDPVEAEALELYNTYRQARREPPVTDWPLRRERRTWLTVAEAVRRVGTVTVNVHTANHYGDPDLAGMDR